MCKCILNREYYALKEIPKYKLFNYNRIFSNLKEPHILKKLISYEFFPKIISTFQDYDNIYLVTTYYEGKSLDYYREQTLTEEQLKFVSACVIQSLIYLRKEKIIHRDIMMKNIIMDKNKYFNIIDFSFSINYSDKKSKRNRMITYDMVTPPEILNRSDFDYNSDYYRLGSVIYYLIFKKYPYIIKQQYNISDIFINHKLIKNYSYACIDFINNLLISDYQKRIGYKDINELKNHFWFKGFDWRKLVRKQISSPFNIFKNDSNQIDCTRFNISMKTIIRYKLYSKNDLYLKLINQYNFVNMLILNKLYK